MTAAADIELSREALDAIAWTFLGSEFAGQIYADWPMDRRLDAYLVHNGQVDFINDGGAYNALLHRVMANISDALRDGVLAQPHDRWRMTS